MSEEKPRQIALEVLRARGRGEFVETLLEAALTRARLSAADRGLCQELVYGVVRWQATLDWLVGRKAQQQAQKPALASILRLGLYQILWLDRIPPHAAVHETVQLARDAGLNTQSGFVNALLRGYLREFETTKKLLAELKTSQPHLGYSHPEWLAQRWQRRWGAEMAANLMEWNNSPPKTFARVNTLKADPARLLPQWREENVEYDFVRRDWLEENLLFELKSHPPLARLPSFQQGLFYVQDPSTLLAVTALGAQRGETVLDLCAAPGGKLTYIAQRMDNQGRLFAHDISPERLELLRQNCARLGVTCLQTLDRQGLGGIECDRILLDAPCSNTGVMRRRIEARWRVSLGEIKRLRQTQLGLLQQAVPLLKPGGTLVYSTCSLEPEENQELVTTFLGEHPLFRLDHEHELLPFRDEVDGAYVAVLKRAAG